MVVAGFCEFFCAFHSLLNKATHERAWADADGKADEGGCEREARDGCACDVHTTPVESLTIWIWGTAKRGFSAPLTTGVKPLRPCGLCQVGLFYPYPPQALRTLYTAKILAV